MPKKQWTRIEDGGAPANCWILVAVEHVDGCPPFVTQAYWDTGSIPRWRTWGFGELPPEAIVTAWHPMPELPYEMMHVAKTVYES